MSNKHYDFIIIGAGIVGAATAYKLQLRYKRKSIALLEKETNIAIHQTGRNSGVIHSGIYYKPGSYKAENCRIGREQLVAFAKGTPVKSSKELSSEENTELPELGSQVLDKVKVVDKDESSDWLTAINESSEEIDYLVGQLDLITKVLPPMFNQIEELYESQLNQTLFSGERKDLKSLRLLETLISEKSSTVVTLHNLRKTVNELVMLQNWVSHKTGAIENN